MYGLSRSITAFSGVLPAPGEDHLPQYHDESSQTSVHQGEPGGETASRQNRRPTAGRLVSLLFETNLPNQDFPHFAMTLENLADVIKPSNQYPLWSVLGRQDAIAERILLSVPIHLVAAGIVGREIYQTPLSCANEPKAPPWSGFWFAVDLPKRAGMQVRCCISRF